VQVSGQRNLERCGRYTTACVQIAAVLADIGHTFTIQSSRHLLQLRRIIWVIVHRQRTCRRAYWNSQSTAAFCAGLTVTPASQPPTNNHWCQALLHQKCYLIACVLNWLRSVLKLLSESDVINHCIISQARPNYLDVTGRINVAQVAESTATGQHQLSECYNTSQSVNYLNAERHRDSYQNGPKFLQRDATHSADCTCPSVCDVEVLWLHRLEYFEKN